MTKKCEMFFSVFDSVSVCFWQVLDDVLPFMCRLWSMDATAPKLPNALSFEFEFLVSRHGMLNICECI